MEQNFDYIKLLLEDNPKRNSEHRLIPLEIEKIIELFLRRNRFSRKFYFDKANRYSNEYYVKYFHNC